MSVMKQIGRVTVCLCLAAAVPAAGVAQSQVAGGPLTGPPVFDAPFSADATTTVQQTLGDGARIERTATARYYRDRAGRVRVEQMIIGLESLNLVADRQFRITVHPDPATEVAYTLDPVARTARKIPRVTAGLAVGGGNTFAVPLGGARFLVFNRGQRLQARAGIGTPVEQESLGTRQIAGVETIGRRLTITIPVRDVGNDRPMQIVDERWESPELKMVIYSHSSDPRTGVVEYRVTNIRRVEPPPEIFMVPADRGTVGSTGSRGSLTLVYAEPLGLRKGGPGGRQP